MALEEEEGVEEEEEDDVVVTVQQQTAPYFSIECTVPRRDTFETAFETFHAEQKLLKGDVTFMYGRVLVREDRTPRHYAMSSGYVIVANWDLGRSEEDEEKQAPELQLEPRKKIQTRAKVLCAKNQK